MKRNCLLLLSVGLLMSCNDATTTTTAIAENNNTTVTEPTPVIQGAATVIKGTVTGLAAGQKIFFDKKTLDATEIMANGTLDANNAFEIKTGIEAAGIYRVRLGAKPVYMLLKGGENVELTAKMNGYEIESYTLTGGLHAEEMKTWSADLDPAKIAKYLSTAKESKPLLDLYLVEKLDIMANIKLYKKVLEQLVAAYPNDTYTKQFTSKVLSTEAKISAQPVGVGAEAPEINLPNPDGKLLSLRALRGKVVLLDFWASWCRPCRMTNPHVVEMYKKYSSKGFDIFNVSLDGLDDKRMMMYQSDANALAQATELERSKWKQAIKDDKLTWKNHVSELRSWNSPVAATYQVNSIPKTFVLDRKGVIRYQDLRGEELEKAIKTLLAE